MKIAFAKPELPESGSLAVAIMDGRKLGLHAAFGPQQIVPFIHHDAAERGHLLPRAGIRKQ